MLAQNECPVFPKAKKTKRAAEKAVIRMSNFYHYFPVWDKERSFSNTVGGGLGISQSWNKFNFQFDLGGATNLNQDIGYGYQAMGIDYFFKKNHSGWGINTTAHRFVEESASIIPAIGIVHTKTGRLLYRKLLIAAFPVAGVLGFQVGFRWGININ